MRERSERSGCFDPVKDSFPSSFDREASSKQHHEQPIRPIPIIPIIPTVQPGEIEVGQFFPSKLAVGFGMAKIIFGILEVSFGVVALFVNAELSGFGGGLWAGTVVTIAGSLGVFAGRHPHRTSHILSFLFASMLCLAVTGLLVIFTATGLARDATAPPKIVVDTDGHRIPFLGEINSRTPAVLVNVFLLTFAIISCILSIFCCLICMREACQCYTSFWELSDPFSGADSQTRKDRLVSWLEQQASEESGSQKSHSPKHDPAETRSRIDEDGRGRHDDLESSRSYSYKVSKKYTTNGSYVSNSTTRTQLTYDSNSDDFIGSERQKEERFDSMSLKQARAAATFAKHLEERLAYVEQPSSIDHHSRKFQTGYSSILPR